MNISMYWIPQNALQAVMYSELIFINAAWPTRTPLQEPQLSRTHKISAVDDDFVIDTSDLKL